MCGNPNEWDDDEISVTQHEDKKCVYCNDCRYLVVYHDYYTTGWSDGSYIRCKKMGVRTMKNVYHKWQEYGNPGDWNQNNDCTGFKKKNKWVAPVLALCVVLGWIIFVCWKLF